ncbi:MAG: ATP-dependent DNA helicase [Actinobacteria bacterium]|nr:ATP-dependent DNA helicase [Actinomycetota bacterium]
MSKAKVTLVGNISVAPAITLSSQQSSVVAHRNSPIIALGAPGTGKTTVLIHSALARITEGQNPDSILLITFGRESASDLRDAIALQTSATMYEPLARTFHSLAFSILKMKSHIDDPDPILLSGPEQESFIRDLLEGDIADGYRQWPEDLHLALSTHGFARELRDLILRASERGVTPEKLEEYAQSYGEKYWQGAADFWKRYNGAMFLREVSAGDSKLRIDPSELLSRAIRHLEINPDLLSELRNRFKTIMVDEFQETDPAQRRLLRLLAPQDLVLVGDAHSAIGRFRGADPDGMSTEIDYYLKQNGTQIILDQDFRSAQSTHAVGLSVSSNFRLTGQTHQRACVDEKTEGVVAIERLRSVSEEAQYIAYQFRRAHLVDGVPYSQMAVLVRSPGSLTSAVRRAFAQISIPVAGELEALATNASIAPFILLAEIAIKSKNLNTENVERLLLSECGGADAISLRRIRRALLANRADDDKRTGNQLLIEAVDTGDVSIEGAEPILRINLLLSKARAVVKKSDARGEDLLWAIWDNAQTSDGAKLSTAWQDIALRGGNRGAAADRDLDAMMQLFQSAQRFSERFPLSGAQAFIREISAEIIAGDVITAQGQRPDCVEILTVHAAKGREWDLVAVAGLQEGSWPNLRQRSSLLGAERLVERERHGNLARTELDVIAAGALLEDERRLLHVATTRARHSLFVTCVSYEDDQPSQFFEEIAGAILNRSSEELEQYSLPRPITTPALVAELRSALSSERANDAASIIKALSDAGIHSADPQSWTGVAQLSTTEPIIDPTKAVPISPSSAENFTECGMKWFLEKSGGTDGDSIAPAIHAFAALMVQEEGITESILVEKLKNSWNLIDPQEGWVSKGSQDKAIAMISRFMKYHIKHERDVVGVELKFDVTVGKARIIGTVDRLEVDSAGNLFVIDFKTSKDPISYEKAKENLQLKSYQIAVTEGGFKAHHASTTSSGAALVYLGHDVQKISSREQEPIDIQAARTQIEGIAQSMGAAQFVAATNKRCKECPVKSSCPIKAEGRTVIE